jgi:hypothetical protein
VVASDCGFDVCEELFVVNDSILVSLQLELDFDRLFQSSKAPTIALVLVAKIADMYAVLPFAFLRLKCRYT